MSQPDEPQAPYRAPHPPPHKARWNSRAIRAFALALASVLAVPASIALAVTLFRDGRGSGTAVIFVGALAALVLAWLGVGRGWAVSGEIVEPSAPTRGRGFALAAIPVGVLGALFSLFGFFAAWITTLSFGRGRQLRRRGRILLAPVEPSGRWTTLSMALAVDDAARDGLAAQWRENGRTEHASVAAFARLSLDLMALGAPAAMLAAASRDALDEVRHTELCFSLARAIDGRGESPGAFREAAAVGARSSVRAVALAGLAVDSLIDGALHEGVSARVVAKLARRCEVAAIREALREIAADEGRHAAHGWDVVEWCLAEGGAPVAEALESALEALPEAMRTALPAAASDGSWERWGIHGHALEAAEYAGALLDLRARVKRLCATARA